jgi:hypothetical protein
MMGNHALTVNAKIKMITHWFHRNTMNSELGGPIALCKVYVYLPLLLSI